MANETKDGETGVENRSPLRHTVGLLCANPVDLEIADRRNQCQHLESALATAFVSMQATYNPGERQGYWLECLRLAKEIERLNEHD